MSASNSTANKLLSILNDLAEDSINQSPKEFMQALPERVCQCLSVPVCILWIRDDHRDVYKVLATAGEVDDEYKKIEINVNHPGVQFPSNQQVFSLSDITQTNYRLADKEQLIKREWKSLLSSPLKIQQEVIGILDIFTKDIRRFQAWEKEIFLSIANYATLSLAKIKLLEENIDQKNKLDNLTEKLRKLTKIMLDITNATKIDQLYQLLLEGALKLVTPAKIMIFRLDYRTGKLNVVKTNSTSYQKRVAKYGEGVIGKALERNQPTLMSDTNKLPYNKDYIAYWQETKSVLIIPILIDKIQVRVGTKIEEGSKAIGVLNLESPEVSGFDESDQDLLLSLARHAAIEIERIRSEKKVLHLRKIEQKIANEQNYEKIIEAVLQGITETLKFEIVNISLVNQERTHIKSEYVRGISESQISKFKIKADHSLLSNDIQADIVRTKIIEVPSKDDWRFDQVIYQEFAHQNLIRVFIPMIEAISNLVIGTVEAGYNRKYRKYIYEWDVQILESFVYVAVQALERRKSVWLDRITHELKAPTVGIRANASFLQRRLNQIDQSLICIKLNDIMADSKMLIYQIKQLESFWRGSNYKSEEIERVLVIKNVVIKTINQFKSIINERGLPILNIKTPRDNRDIQLAIYTDKILLNQVVYNLLMNSIKYAEEDPEKFKIVVDIKENRGNFLKLSFKDWGIGIQDEYKEKIFEEGFRESAAMRKNVSGSGLGLFISRKIMRGMKGDLQLINNYKPTEFLLTIYNHKF